MKSYQGVPGDWCVVPTPPDGKSVQPSELETNLADVSASSDNGRGRDMGTRSTGLYGGLFYGSQPLQLRHETAQQRSA